MESLAGSVALITGAARGQGRSHAVRLADEGAHIVALDACVAFDSIAYSFPTLEDLDETARIVRERGRRIIALQADVRERAQLDRVVEEAISEFGHVDIVVANAGIYAFGQPFWNIPHQQWRDTIDVNLTGVWNTASAVVPSMIQSGRRGSVIVISSLNGLKGGAKFADYISSKHGLIGLVKAMANDLAEHHIRVNAICPTSVNTPMFDNEAMYRFFRPDMSKPRHDDIVEASQAMHLLPEPWVDPIDVSNAVAWLASDEARFVTGIALPIDLGSTAKF